MGWITSIFTRNRSHLVKKEGVRSNVRARMKTPLSFRASAGASGGECRFEWKGDPCKYRHDPTDKSREKNESGGVVRQWGRTQETQGWCSHDTERFRVGRRRRERKGGSSAKSSKGDDEKGCGLRQLAGSTLATERARVSADDVQLVRPRLASFSQPGAELGASGCRSLRRNFGHQYLRRSVA